MHRIRKEHIIYAMSPENNPCIEVEIGSLLYLKHMIALKIKLILKMLCFKS